DQRPIGALVAACQAQRQPDALHAQQSAELGAIERQRAEVASAERDLMLGKQAPAQRPPLQISAGSRGRARRQAGEAKPRLVLAGVVVVLEGGGQMVYIQCTE